MVPQLHGSMVASNVVTGSSESNAGSLLSLSSYHLGTVDQSESTNQNTEYCYLSPGLPGSLSFSSHGSLQLDGKADILDLNSLNLSEARYMTWHQPIRSYLDTPGVSGLVQSGLHVVSDLLSLGQKFIKTLGAKHISVSTIAIVSVQF